MSLIDSLTSEDLPLSYRFPRWNSTLYYPCASIVIFDVDARDSEVEYHIFVAEVDVNPESDDPRLSVTNMDGNWRDLTGRAITSITSFDSESATETTVTLTINYDDTTSEDVSFTIPLSPAPTSSTDSDSVALFVDSSGNLIFGGNFVDAATARTAIREILEVDYDRLLFSPALLGTQPGFVADEYIDDLGGSHNILNSFVTTAVVGKTGSQFFIQTRLIPTGPADFLPTFTLAALPQGALAWDEPATGWNTRLINPSDRDGFAFIRVTGISQSGGTTTGLSTYPLNVVLESTGSQYTLGGASGIEGVVPTSGIVQLQYRTDGGSHIRPVVTGTADRNSEGGEVIFTVDIGQFVDKTNTIINNDLINEPDGPDTFESRSITYDWAFPALALSVTALGAAARLNFLQAYDSLEYAFSHSGISEIATNSLNVATGSGTTTTNFTRTGITNNFTGTLAFAAPIYKDDLNTVTRDITVVSTFDRPESVMGPGNGYTTTVMMTDTVDTSHVEFYEPVFMFESIAVDPSTGENRLTVDQIVNTLNLGAGSDFNSNVTVIMNNNIPVTDPFADSDTPLTIINSMNFGTATRAVWFGIPSSVRQPTDVLWLQDNTFNQDLIIESEVFADRMDDYRLDIEPVIIQNEFTDYLPVEYRLYGRNLRSNITNYRFNRITR